MLRFVMHKVRETKRTFRYEDDESHIFYIQKSELKQIGTPDTIIMEVKAHDEKEGQ